MSIRGIFVVAALGLVACTDAAQPRGPGILEATLHSPSGDEGAAVLLLVGEGVLGVESVGDTEAHAVTSGETTRIVLINKPGGTLVFDVITADLSRPLVGFVQEVAGADDELRTDLSGYRVDIAVGPGR